MSESVGKQLLNARKKRGLSVEEVAHETKLRPEKIHALEQDDYAQFANNAYAKGFLQLYARYLRVDVSQTLQALDTSNRIAVSDYQYLTNGIQRREPEKATFSFSPKRQVPSIVPLIAFAAIVVLGIMGFQVYVNWQRVTGVSTTKEQVPATDNTPATAQADPQPETKAPAPAQAITPAEPQPAAPVPPVNPAVAAPAPVAVGPAVNEVLVEPIKKTWIAVRRDDPKSAPVFEDFVYPDARPLKVKGVSIFIEARDPSAILIRKNGAPIAYAPGVAIR